MELCGWGRYLATSYTYGTGVPGNYMPDLENAACILFWGYNPNLARPDHAVSNAFRPDGANFNLILTDRPAHESCCALLHTVTLQPNHSPIKFNYQLY